MFSFSKMVMRDSLWFCAKIGRENWFGISTSTFSFECCECQNLQHSRWAWRRSSSQCGRSCCRCRPRSRGSLPSPGQTAAHKSWSAHSPPSCKAKESISQWKLQWAWQNLERISLVTYAPHSTFRERMFSIPHSMMFWQLAVNSIRLPWKCSWSYTVICNTCEVSPKTAESTIKTIQTYSLRAWGMIIHRLSHLPGSHGHWVCLSHFGLYFSDEPMGKRKMGMVEKATYIYSI